MASGSVNPTIRVQQAESVPEDATVRHYDELSNTAKQNFPALARGVPSEAILDSEDAREFTDGEFVVFTGYYRVNVA